MEAFELIVGNSNRRFSGVTASMLSSLPCVSRHLKLVVLGGHFVPDSIPTINYKEFIRLCQKALPCGKTRVFHARRNNEMIQALIAKKFFGAKLRIVFTSTAQRSHSWLTCYLISQMDGIISTCKAAASYLEKPPDTIIPHGVNTEMYHPAPCKIEAWKALGYPGKYGIGIFGRVRYQKGVDLFVKAAILVAAKYPSYTFLIGGEITPSNQAFVKSLQLLVQEAGMKDRILFIGKQPVEHLPVLFRSVSAVAALSRNEGFGLTPLEAMASGTAVVCSNAGAWPEIIHQGQEGFCLPNPDAKAIAKIFDQMMSKPEQMVFMGQKGRKRVETYYTVDREASLIADFLGSQLRR